MRENRKHITRVSSDEARHLKDETDYARLDAMTDDDIAQAVAEDPDAAPLDLDWTQARLSLPPGKDVVTLRLDRDVLEWFRTQGKGYQTRINQALRAFYEARRNPLAAAPGRGSNARVDELLRAVYEARRNPLAADPVEGVKAPGRGSNALEQVLRETLDALDQIADLRGNGAARSRPGGGPGRGVKERR
jgi:uncharacterized protein (DUF4415 family)